MRAPRVVLSTFWPRWPSQFRATAGQKVVPWRNGHATHPAARIGLSTGRGRLVPLLAFLCHDSWSTPSGLTTRVPQTTPSRGCYRCENFVPLAVTTSPIESPFDRRGRHWPAPRRSWIWRSRGPFAAQLWHKRLSKPRHRPREEAQCAPSPYVPPSARAHPPSAPNRVLFSTALEPA